jgi:hypothetical protein
MVVARDGVRQVYPDDRPQREGYLDRTFNRPALCLMRKCNAKTPPSKALVKGSARELDINESYLGEAGGGSQEGSGHKIAKGPSRPSHLERARPVLGPSSCQPDAAEILIGRLALCLTFSVSVMESSPDKPRVKVFQGFADIASQRRKHGMRTDMASSSHARVTRGPFFVASMPDLSRHEIRKASPRIVPQ